MRLAVLGLSHEGNTFSRHGVDARVIEAATLRGDDIVARHAGGTSTMSGYLEAGTQLGIEVVPLIVTEPIPGGPITSQALNIRVEEMTQALAERGPFDGVLAALHGAAVSEDIPDVDGYLLRKFREVVGQDVPIGASLDLHANISSDMCTYSDVLNTYRTNPHLDAKEVAEEIASIVTRSARGEIRPTQAFEAIPTVINILCQNTAVAPMSDIMSDLRATMEEPGVLSATVAEGYPYADVPKMGMSVVVVTDNDPDGARRFAQELGEKVWLRREQFVASAPSACEAIELVGQDQEGPVLLLDVGDNIGGGSPGDSVVLLGAAIRAGLENLLTIIADPAAVEVCDRAGTAARVDLSIGGKEDPETGPPVHASGTVLSLNDGVYEADDAVHAGVRVFNAGRSAAVLLDTGQTVVLTRRATLPFTTAQLTSLGLVPQEFKAIVAKGVHSPVAGYGPYVRKVLAVNTPGVTSAELKHFSYRHRRRPLYPFEPEANYGEG